MVDHTAEAQDTRHQDADIADQRNDDDQAREGPPVAPAQAERGRATAGTPVQLAQSKDVLFSLSHIPPASSSWASARPPQPLPPSLGIR